MLTYCQLYNLKQNIQKFSLMKIHLKLWSTKYQLFCSGLNLLTNWGRDKMAAIFQMTFSNAFSWMKIYEFFIKMSLNFVPKGPVNNIPALVQILAWRQPGDKPISEPMMVRFVTQPQWVKILCLCASVCVSVWVVSVFAVCWLHVYVLGNIIYMADI